MFYIFEMANNHMGSVDHAKKIIDDFANLAKRKNINAGIKLQFRNLDTFIHPDYQDRNDLKYVKRFNETRLNKEQFSEIINYIKSKNLLSVSTPFDNESLPLFDDLGVEPTGRHFGKDCNVLGEILLSRYDLFLSNNIKTHATTNLNAQELEERYGNRVRSRMRELFNLVGFDKESKDKRK